MLIFEVTWVDYPCLDTIITEFPNFTNFEPKDQLIFIFPTLCPITKLVLLESAAKLLSNELYLVLAVPGGKKISADYFFQPNFEDEKLNPRIFHVDF